MRQGRDLAARLLKQAQVESGEDISWGGQVERFEVMEHDLACSSKTPPHAWTEAIEKTKRYPIFIDGSRSSEGVVGGGYYLQQG